MMPGILKTLFKPSSSMNKEALETAAREAESANDAHGLVVARRALAKLDPRAADAWLALGRALRKAGEPREAIAAYREAVRRGAAAVEAHLQLGVLHAELSEHERAIEHLEKVIAEEPRNTDALCMLGTVMSDARRLDEAAVLFERALAYQPEFPEAHFNLGLIQFERSEFGRASRSFTRCVALSRGEPWTKDRLAPLQRDPQTRFDPKDMAVNEVKLRHDCEQLEHLLALGRLPPAYRDVLDDYRSLLEEIRGKLDASMVVPFDHAKHPLVARSYKRPVHISEAPPPASPLINPALDIDDIENRYLAAKPKMVTLDGLLAPTALQALRCFCRESTIWNNIYPGYLGAFFYDGFCSELLLRLAWELRECLPRVIGDLPLQMMWGYKCDSRLPGLGVHADAAAVNVNFWITEDEANLDPAHGGLLVYTHDAPKDWGFAKFNTDSGTILRYLDSVGSVPVCVPYRANRAVIFDSDLFHASDRPHFRDGYQNRRINITILYGSRSM